MLIYLLWVLLATNCWGQVLGNWKMMPGKFRQDRGASPKAVTVKYEAHSGKKLLNEEIWTFYQVHASGISETISQTLRFDGKEYPCGDLGLEERADTVVSTKLDAWTTEVSYKKAGRVTRQIVRTLSPDGKQMTLQIRINPEKAPVMNRVLVFARSAHNSKKGDRDE